MRRDFADHYSVGVKNKQKIVNRDPAGGSRSGKPRWLWRASGVVVTTAMVIGLAGSLWFGHLISRGLDELALRHEQIRSLEAEGSGLRQQRARLLSDERIQAAARELGLLPPGSSQVQRP